MTRFATAALALSGWLFLSGVGAAQTPPKELAGAWVGTLKVNEQIALRLALRVEGGKAVIDSLDQGVKDIAVNEISCEKGKVALKSDPIQASYEGQLDAAKGEISGTWTQPGGSFPLVLKKAKSAELAVGVAAPKELTGVWNGKLEVNDQISFRLAFRVENGRAVLDSLDQNVNGIPITSLSLKGDQLEFGLKGIAATFKGRHDAKAGELTGTWTQPGGSWPLTLRKAAD